MTDQGQIRAGIGGWTFQPWEGTFYPNDLPKRKQLEFASRQLRTIEINSTYYRSQTPATFGRWAAETPANFVFSVKGSRFVTNRKILSEAGDSLAMFFDTGIRELGAKLGPIVWQFAPTKKFEPADFEGFLKLLPSKSDGMALRHVLEVRHPSFIDPQFVSLAEKYKAAICHADHHVYPEIGDVTSDFVYSRLQKGNDDIATAYAENDLSAWAKRIKRWSEGHQATDLQLAAPDRAVALVPREVFVYFIHEGKLRGPQAAIALQNLL